LWPAARAKAARPPMKVPQIPRMCICMGADSKVMAKNACRACSASASSYQKKSFFVG
jgi:hypothetical protein